MYKVGDYVVYKRDVCKIIEIKYNYLSNTDYYIMHPIDDNSLIIQVPKNNKLGLLRDIISKEEAEKLIKSIPTIDIIDKNDKLIENEYKMLMKTNKMDDLIKIIKTTYLRNDNRKQAGKKIGEKDDIYFKNAEKILYNELSISLNMSFNEVKEYVINKVQSLSN